MFQTCPLSRSRLLAGIVAFSLCLAGTTGLHAFAQSADTAGLEIYLHDPSGAAVVGAKVHIEQQETHIVRDGVTDERGEYRFTAIPAGDYVLTTNKDGFAEMVEAGIALSVGQEATLNLNLRIAKTSEQVNVTAEVPIVDLDRSAIGQTVSNTEVQNLPTLSRSFTDFAVTVPGVTAQASSGQGSGLSFNGARARSNNILIDGVENNGQLNGTVRQTLSLDAISQFQVMTAQFLPEYGNAGGGMINIITKTGSSQLAGDIYYFAQNTVLNATPYCFGVSPCNRGSYVSNDVGGALGGPLDKHQKTFFFASGEYLGINAFTNDLITSANVASINSALSGATGHPLVNSSVKSINNSNIPLVTAQTLGSLRVDHTFSEKDTSSARLLYGHYRHANPLIDSDDGALSDYSNFGYDRLSAFSLMGEETHVFSPTLLNEFHFQYSPQHLTQFPNASGPSAYIDGIAQIGQNYSFPTVLNETHYEWIDAISKTRGTHLFKTGADILYIRSYNAYPEEQQGLWEFGNVSDFTAGTPYELVQQFGNFSINEPDKILSFYGEDQWKVTPRLSLNYGGRYDLDLQPQGFNQDPTNAIQSVLPKGIARDYNNISPRIGFAYSVTKSGSTVVRGGFGMFYDKIFLIVARDELLPRETLKLTTVGNLLAGGAPNTTTQLNTQYAAGPYPLSTTYPTGGPAPSIYAATNHQPIPYAIQSNLYLDQALSTDWSVELGYINVGSSHLLRADNINLPAPVILTSTNATGGTPNFQQLGRPYFSAARLNSAFKDITEYGSWGHANYNALTGAIIHRTTRELTLRASWTWSKEIDDSADFTKGLEPQNVYFPRDERALGTQDQRNRFVGSAVYRFPYAIHRGGHNSALRWAFGDWIGSTVSIIASGTPQDITTGSDSNGDGNDTDRPYINGLNGLQGGTTVRRDDFRGARSQSVNIRLQKELPFSERWRLQFSVESFNSFNHANFGTPYLFWGTAATPNGYINKPLVWGTPYGAPGETSQTFGAYTSVGAARDIQLGTRLFF